MTDIIINPGTSIQTTINGAASGDRILLNAGTYSVDNTITVSKSVTLAANVPGSLPNVKLNFSTYAYGLVFGASNITVNGLDIDNTRGGGAGVGYIHNSAAISNLVIRNSKIHDFRRMFVGDGGNVVTGFTFEDNQMTRFQYTAIEIDNAINIGVRRNWIHDQFNTSSGEGAVTYYVQSNVGTSEISYNYIQGTRIGIEVAPQAVTAASSGSLVVCHNTLDAVMQAIKPSNVSAPYCMRYGTSFWSAGTNKLNGLAIDWRDNLITRTLVEPLYISDGASLYSALTMRNCMFWDNYWYYWPTTGRSLYESYDFINDRLGQPVPATKNLGHVPYVAQTVARYWRVVAGTGNATDLPLLTLTNCRTVDPCYAMTGSTPQSFYALIPGSPAIGAATDGTNIGAWQS